MNRMLPVDSCPDENDLARFVEGSLSGEELTSVKKHLDMCSLCNDVVRMVLELDFPGKLHEIKLWHDPAIQKRAALSEHNLCVLYAEMHILKVNGILVSLTELMDLSVQHGWLTQKGVQFKNIGKILEHYGLPVERKTNATTADIRIALGKGFQVIVGVDAGELFPHSGIEKIYEIVEDWFERRPDHALIVTGLKPDQRGKEEFMVLNFDNGLPAEYSFTSGHFLDAWDDSDNFLVIVKKGS